MTSQPEKHSQVPRRAVLGTALGGAAAAALPGTAHAEPHEQPVPSDGEGRRPWRLRDTMSTDGAWAGFLRGQDLQWARLPTLWYEGPFLGDGLLGSMIYQEPDTHRIRLTVQHGRVQDHRPQFGSGWGTCRLPVGRLTLEPTGTITAVDWRLSLWNAELTGTVTTTAATLTLAALIHDEVLAVRVTADGGEQVTWTFHPEEAISPRKISEAPPSGYTANPPWTTRTSADGTEQVLQPLTGGGQTATAYRRTGDDLLLSVGHSHPSDTAAEADSLRNLRRAASYDALRRRHTRWWHAFYRKSFVSFPDQRLQSFHWIQLYKVASASRAAWPRHGHLRSVAGAHALARGLVEPQRPAGVLAHPRFQPPGARRARHHGAAEPGTAHRQRARRLPRRQLRRRPQLRHVRQPGSGQAGHRRRDRRPHLGAAQRVAVLPALHGPIPAARHGLPRAAPGDQLLPALPQPGQRRQAPPAEHTLSRIPRRAAPGHQLRPGPDPLGLPDTHRVRRTPRHRRRVGPALAGGAGQAHAVPGRRQRLHDRRGHPVRAVPSALLASAHGLPAVPRQLGPAREPRPDHEVDGPLARADRRPPGIQLHRCRIDVRDDRRRRHRDHLPAEVLRPRHPLPLLLPTRTTPRPVRSSRPRCPPRSPCTTCSARAGAA